MKWPTAVFASVVVICVTVALLLTDSLWVLLALLALLVIS